MLEDDEINLIVCKELEQMAKLYRIWFPNEKLIVNGEDITFFKIDELEGLPLPTNIKSFF